MTGVDDAEPAVRRSPVSKLARPLRPYADIFRIPGAWRFSAAGVIGRMPMSMFGLGTVLLISAATGKYGVAGTVSAVGSFGAGLLSVVWPGITILAIALLFGIFLIYRGIMSCVASSMMRRLQHVEGR